MRARRPIALVASIASLCTIAALAVPAATANAAQAARAKGAQRTYLIFLRSPSTSVATSAERNLVRGSQNAVTTELASLGVKPLHSYLVPDVITAKLRAAQAASIGRLASVDAVLPNGIIPAPKLTTQPVKLRTGPNGVSPHLAAGVCGSSGNPQLDPEALNNINAEPAIKAGDDGAGVNVAFIADGIDTTIPDFQRNAAFASSGSPAGDPVITNYVDFGGDGTAASTSGGEAFLDASSIAAQANTVYDLSNYVNPAHPLPAGCDMVVQGDAPGATVTAIKVFSNSFTTNADFVAAINYAVTSGVKVLNESFGSNPFPDDSLDATKLADNAAVRAGVTVVASSGDAGVTNTIGTPADDPLVIGVGATTTFRSYQQETYGGINVPGIGNGKVIDNNISGLSSGGFTYNGKTIDLVAPGDLNWALCSTSANYADCGGSNLELSGGTSESAPLTSGAAADVIAAYAATHHGTDPTPALVKRILTSTAQDIYAPAEQQGAGLLDVTAAVHLARSIPGTTAAHPAGGLLASTSQLDLSGAPGTKSTGSVSLTNTSSSTVSIKASIRSLVQKGAKTGSVTLDPSDATTQPHFPIWSGYQEVYQTSTFKVPAKTDRLEFQAGYQDTNQASLVHIALFNPAGTYAGYSLPQGQGDYANVQVADPAAGKWTAVFFTVWDQDGTGNGSSGPVPWTASYWNYEKAGSVNPGSVSIGAGHTKSIDVKLTNPSSPGDTAYSLVLGGGTTIPITLRTTVPTGGNGKFSGVLTGGNGRGGAPAQTDIYSFNVPSGKSDLDASIAMSSNAPDAALPGAQFVGELVDPSGQVQAFDSNYTYGASGFEVTPYVDLYKSAPVAGTWELVLNWVNPVMGVVDAIPYKGAIKFNLVSQNSTLPDSSSSGVPTAGASYSVTVHNTGLAPLLLSPDGRLNSETSYGLSDAFGGSATQSLPGVADNAYYVPNGTSSVTVDQTSTVKASFDFSTYPGDPDLSPLNGNLPGIATTQTSSSASLTYTPPAGVTPGLWFDGDSEVGPFTSPAPSGSETTSVSIQTRAFDPAITSTDGDYVQALTTGGAAANEVEVEPGSSVVIPITITPTGTVGSIASGTLFIIGLSGPGAFVPSLGPADIFTNALAAIPYKYKITA
jgi:hypothetical protein